MNVQIILKNLDTRLSVIEESLVTALKTLRTDRANPAMVEEIMVDAYQSRMRIKELASITVPEAKVLVIQPWDRSVISAVQKALETSDLGTSPVVQGEIIRVVLPPMSQERRQELTKVIGKKVEETKISVRQAREDAIKETEQLQKTGSISEDDKFAAKDEIQKRIDAVQQKMISLGKTKEEEVLTV